MYIEFKKKYLQELYDKGTTSDKKHRFQPEIIRNYIKRVQFLKYARDIEELYPIKSLNYEVLKGDKAGISSIRINNKYRLEFTVKRFEKEEIMTICSLSEISNHYK